MTTDRGSVISSDAFSIGTRCNGVSCGCKQQKPILWAENFSRPFVARRLNHRFEGADSLIACAGVGGQHNRPCRVECG
jgi:hypothetical protein